MSDRWHNIYTNAIGESVLLRFEANDAHGWEYDGEAAYGRISGWKPKARTVTYSVVTLSIAERDEIRHVLMYDAQHGTDGTLEWDGWKMPCRAQKIGYSHWELPRYKARMSVEFLPTDGLWHRTTTVHMESVAADGTGTTGLDLPTDFPFDLAGTSVSSREVEVGQRGGTLMIGARFYGPCSSPYARITSEMDGKAVSNLYGVNATAAAGEQIVIDPTRRTETGMAVYLRAAYGGTSNLYDSRVRGNEGSGSYVWQTLPAGYLSITVPQDVSADIDIIEEVPAPPWI